MGSENLKITIVIPNYNGKKFLKPCLDSLQGQLGTKAQILLVDNGSGDGSLELMRAQYPDVRVLELQENTGFCHAVNVGIQESDTQYVILLNNDTEVKSGFIDALLRVMEQPGNEKVFSAGAMMLDMHQPELIDDAGDRLNALGWAFSRGKGKAADKFNCPAEVFAACGGAAIYRRSVFEEIGFFDELHFAYLEDVDIGYRALIHGYRNLYEPKARVLHAGSASSGSRYNAFKTKLVPANNVYMIWKNMPLLQWILNLPLLIAGFAIKLLFFAVKGMGGLYLKGLMTGLGRCFSKQGREHKVTFRLKYLGNYLEIQWQLWLNIFRRLCE